jgi:putative endonuclease
MYILECADGSYYTGSTWDLERRLWEHQSGLGAKHTAKRLPVKLVFCEECDRVEDAYAREKQIQGWSRKKKQALMAGDWDRMHQLAECRNRSHSRNLGFDSAQPTSLDQAADNSSAQRSPTPSESHSPAVPLSEAERGVEAGRSLSGVEGNAGCATEPSVASKS